MERWFQRSSESGTKLKGYQSDLCVAVWLASGLAA